MVRNIFLLLSTAILLIIGGCSSTKETSSEKTVAADSVLVFEEVAPDTLAVPIPAKDTIPPPLRSTFKYYVQVGAFATEAKAVEFGQVVKKKLNKEVTVFLNPQVKLFVVEILPAFSEKAQAEAYRDEIKKIKEFLDAWIYAAEE